MAELRDKELSFEKITVTGDGVKRISQLLLEIMGQITSTSQFKESSYISINRKEFFRLQYITYSGVCYFSWSTVYEASKFLIESLVLDFSTNPNTVGFYYYDSSTDTVTHLDYALSNGDVIELHF